MKYQRAALIDLARKTREAHVALIVAKHKADQRKHTAQLARWNTTKPDHLKRLEDTLTAIREDRPHDLYQHADRIPQPPGPAPQLDDTCSPRVTQLDALLALLDTVADEQITSSALAASGFRDLGTLLRHPCP